MTTFRIQNNTDSVDIDQKCLGLSAWVEGDSVNLLNTNRGLHIQIRHNKNKETFDAACKLQNLLVAAPEMLSTLKTLMAILPPSMTRDLIEVKALINKVEGV